MAVFSVLAGIGVLYGISWLAVGVWSVAKTVQEWRAERDAEEEERAMFRSLSRRTT